MNRQITRFNGLESITTGKPDYGWSPPDGQEVYTQGARRGIYKDTMEDGSAVTVWSGSNEPTGTESDVVDAGADNDCVIASAGDDRVQGGTGDGQLDGLGGNDVLEGGEGKDNIQVDGITKAGFMNSVADKFHGVDFVDGGDNNEQPSRKLHKKYAFSHREISVNSYKNRSNRCCHTLHLKAASDGGRGSDTNHWGALTASSRECICV